MRKMLAATAMLAVALLPALAVLLCGSVVGAAYASSLDDANSAYSRDDYVTAIRLFRPLADQGNASAQYNLGVMYDIGEGVAQNDARAVNWYRKAADQGHAYAQYSLGFSYEMGRGVPQDDTQAANWYRKAADQGIAAALNSLGEMYEEGRGVPQDYVQAYMWFSLLEAHGIKGSTDDVAAKMTPAQIAEAKKLVKERALNVGSSSTVASIPAPPPPVEQAQAAGKAMPKPVPAGGIENLTYSEQSGNRLYFTGLQQGKPVRIVRTGVLGSGQWAIYSGAPGSRLRLQIDDRLGVRDILAIDQGQRVTVNNFANERIEYRFYGPDSQFITASVIYLQDRRWYHGRMQTETFPGYPALQDVVDITKQVTSNTAPGKTDFAGVLPDLWPYLNLIRPAHAQAGGGLLDRLLGPAPRKSMTQRWEQLDDSTKYTAKMTANGLGILGTLIVGLQKSTPLIDKVVLPLLDEAIVHFPAVALGYYLGDKLYEWDKARQTPAQTQAEDFNDTVQRPRFSSSPMPEPPLAPPEGRYSSMFRSSLDRAAECMKSGDMPCADNALLEGRIYADGSSDRTFLKNAYDRFYRRQTELVDEDTKKRQQKAERPPPAAAASAPAPVVAATPPPAPRPPPAAAPARQAAVSSRSDKRWHRELTAETSHPTSDQEIPHRTDHVDIHGDDPEIPRSAAVGTAKMRGWTSTSAYGEVWDTDYSGCGDCPPGSRIVMRFWTTNYLKGQDFYKLVTVVFVRDR